MVVGGHAAIGKWSLSKKTRTAPFGSCPCFIFRAELLLGAIAIAAEELIDTTSGINELVLASVEWVAGRSNFELYQWILNAINLDGLSSSYGRT